MRLPRAKRRLLEAIGTSWLGSPDYRPVPYTHKVSNAGTASHSHGYFDAQCLDALQYMVPCSYGSQYIFPQGHLHQPLYISGTEDKSSLDMRMHQSYGCVVGIVQRIVSSVYRATLIGIQSLAIFLSDLAVCPEGQALGDASWLNTDTHDEETISPSMEFDISRWPLNFAAFCQSWAVYA